MGSGAAGAAAIDRLQSAGYELVLDGESYRRRQKPIASETHDSSPAARRRRV
jgi:hypothetical protein